MVCYSHAVHIHISFFFFFNDTATTEIYTLSLHDALPILAGEVRPAALEESVDRLLRREARRLVQRAVRELPPRGEQVLQQGLDRKSTRLNSSHANISYAVFCLKKKKKPIATIQSTI